MIARQHAQLAYLNALDADTDERTLDQMCRQLTETTSLTASVSAV